MTILGADTETNHGFARLICIEDRPHFYSPKRGNWREWVEYLLSTAPRIGFYNLRFDVEAILKHFPEQFIKDLLYLTEAEIEFEDRLLTFKLIPWKVFTIREMVHEKNRRRTKRKVECFEVAQFFHTSLNNASKDVLGEEKVEDSRFAAELNTSEEPWKHQLERIISYCQDDASKAGRLIRTFMGSAAAAPISLNPKNPISCAWYAKELIKQCIPETKQIKSIRTNSSYYYSRPWKRWDNVGTQCYFGGRFETPMKGTIEDTYIADINSAYPHWIAQQPNPYNLQFVKDFEPEGDFSMVKAEVWVPEDLPIGPLPYRLTDSIIFPLGNWTAWFHWHELKNAHENFGVEFQVQKALNGYEPNGKQRPFSKRIPEIFTKRAEWKEEGDPRQLSSKVAMNSVYGVWYEKNERIIEESGPHTTEIDGHSLKKKKDNPGRFCYPFIAGWITSKTRVQLINACEPEHVAFFATDGILQDKPFRNIPVSKKLGEWSVKNVEKATVFVNGTYILDGKVKTRGFRKDANKDPRPITERLFECTPLRRCINCKPNKYCNQIFIHNIERGPIHLNSSFRLRDYSLKDALTWIEKDKEMNVTRCKKRIWPDYTIDDLLTKKIRSTPQIVNANLNVNPLRPWKGDSDNEYANRFVLGRHRGE